MPCSGTDYCGTVASSTTGENPTCSALTPFVSDTQIYANMGWVGYVKLESGKLTLNTIIRATSADINLSQEITKPDVIDGRIDPTVYQLGPKIIEGSIGFPLVADNINNETGTFTPTAPGASCPENSTAGSLVDKLFCWGTARGGQGRMVFDDMKMIIRYANHALFAYNNVIVNTMGFSVAQSDVVTMDIAVIGQTRDDGGCNTDPPGFSGRISNYLSPARVFTWADVSVTGYQGDCYTVNEKLFGSHQIREFSFEVNNNAERFFALNGSLYPVDTNVSKREITGSLTTLGLADELRKHAENNQDRFTAKGTIAIGLFVGDDTYSAGGVFSPRDWVWASGDGNWGTYTPVFQKIFRGVVFQIAEMDLGNDLFETTVDWHALASDLHSYTAIYPTSSCYFPTWKPK